MMRIVVVWCCVAGVFAIAGGPGRTEQDAGNGWQAKQGAEGQSKKDAYQQLLLVLDMRLDTKRLTAEEMTLKEGMTWLEEQVKQQSGKELPLLVDMDAFGLKCSCEPGVFDSGSVPANLPRSLTVGELLRALVDKVEVKKATYCVCENHILITTPERCKAEAKLKERVRGVYEKRPLNLVLGEMARKLGTTIIVDARTGDKAKAEVSAAFPNDVPLGSALRCLTDMADLSVVVLDGLIYVTTPVHADALRRDYRTRQNESGATRRRGKFADPLWPFEG